MLNSQGFDAWAKDYDGDVRSTDADGAYPFAGYSRVVETICSQVYALPGWRVLDVGFGTGEIASRLYERGYQVYGQDFSPEMLRAAQARMPQAELYQGDFTQGLHRELTCRRYDAIIATYALHHMQPAAQTAFIRTLLNLLEEGGMLLIGDVAFATRAERDACRRRFAQDWDDEEAYFVYEDLLRDFPGQVGFRALSFCAGVLAWRKPRTEDLRLTAVVPSPRQLAFQQTAFYAFIHLTVNTFTGREWGDGSESPAIFNPKNLDARQWVQAVKAAGMKGLILTCKHHDGFCLWPSRYTDHTVASSPWKDGRGDVVREVSQACREAGLKFGVYLSPWDRHSPLYGQGKPYDDYFIAQLTELLTGYGPIFCVWLDGACGEGANGKKQHYDWERYYQTVRMLQPEACINVCGPDVRWCGNEAGDTRPEEWSVVPRRMMDTEKIASASQQQEDTAFRQRKLSAGDMDLGSRAALADEQELIWYPAEVNTSIRPGWFWHAEENDSLRSLEELWHIYEHSVGGNATFLLNIPPTDEGLLHAHDVQRLQAFGQHLALMYGRNLLEGEDVCAFADWEAPGHEARCALAPGDETWYMPPEGFTAAMVTLRWQVPKTLRRLVLRENIRLSQRVERFTVDVLTEAGWHQAHEGRVIGYQCMIPLEEDAALGLRLRIKEARLAPTIAFIGAY